jgi:hypothetical protein
MQIPPVVKCGKSWCLSSNYCINPATKFRYKETGSIFSLFCAGSIKETGFRFCSLHMRCAVCIHFDTSMKGCYSHAALTNKSRLWRLLYLHEIFQLVRNNVYQNHQDAFSSPIVPHFLSHFLPQLFATSIRSVCLPIFKRILCLWILCICAPRLHKGGPKSCVLSVLKDCKPKNHKPQTTNRCAITFFKSNISKCISEILFVSNHHCIIWIQSFSHHD